MRSTTASRLCRGYGRRNLATRAATGESEVAPVFPNRFQEQELKNLTLYSVSSINRQSRPSVALVGSNSIRAFKWLCGNGADAGEIAGVKAAVLAKNSMNGFAVYYSDGKQSELDKLEIYADNNSQINSIVDQITKLGWEFKQATSEDLIKKFYSAKSLKLETFEELKKIRDTVEEEKRRFDLRMIGVGMDSMYQVWLEELQNCKQLLSASPVDPALQGAIDRIVKSRLNSLQLAWSNHVSDSRRSPILSKSCQITIFGAPNSGKSSFINIISQSMVSPVGNEAGTTKSILDQASRISGIPIMLTDTVGLQQSNSDEKTLERMESCDLKICMLDINDIYNDKSKEAINPDILNSIDSDTLVLINKRDTIDIRIPEPPAKIRFKNTPLSPQGDVQRHAMRGRVPLRLDGDTTGNSVKYGDFGLRVLSDVRLTEACLQECRATMHRHIKKVRGGRFWIRVKPEHPMSKKAIGTRMGKGKAPFSHWEAKVPNKLIVFEIGGGVREDIARYIFKSVAARVPGKTEFVVAPKEETLPELADRISEFAKCPPLGVWSVSCKTGEGIDEFLKDLSEILAKKYQNGASAMEELPETTQKVQVFEKCAEELENILKQHDNEMISAIPESIEASLKTIINSDAVENAKKFLFHSKYGVLDLNAKQVPIMQQKQQQIENI